MSLTIDIGGLNKAIGDFGKLANEAKTGVHTAIVNFVKNVETDAKRMAPANEGVLKGSITGDVQDMKGSVVVRANYGAFLEFGTRKFASVYVATLPADWQAYAATFKGKGGGTFAEFLKNIMQWVKQKGIGGFQTAGGNMSKSKDSIAAQEQAAYLIARSILIKGIRPQPYLYPAVKKYTPVLIADVKKVFGI